MIVLLAIVVVAVVLLVLAGRRSESVSDGLRVRHVGEDGLTVRIDSRDELVEWPSVFQVAVITRKSIGRTWFGFEVLSEDRGLLHVSGSAGRGEAFLAQSYRLPGFDHGALKEALVGRRARAVCFSR